MRRRLSGILLILVAFSVVVAACAPTLAPTPVPSKPPIKIGGAFILTGPVSPMPLTEVMGLKMAFDEVGWQVAGRKIELIEEDTAFDPALTVTKVKKLVELDKVHILVGADHSGAASPVRDYLHERAVPGVLINAAKGLSRELYSPYVFSVTPSTYQWAYEPSKWLFGTGKKSAIWVGWDYTSAQEGFRATKFAAEETGAKIVAEHWVPVPTVDFGAYLTKVKADEARADVIFFAMWGGGNVTFVQGHKEFGLTKPLFPMAAANEEGALLPQMGDAAIGMLNAYVYSPMVDTPDNNKFVKTYREKAGKYPGHYAYIGYTAGKLILSALEAVKGEVEDSKKLAGALEKAKFPGLMGGDVYFDERHRAVYANVPVTEVRKVGAEVHQYPIGTIPALKDPWDKFPD